MDGVKGSRFFQHHERKLEIDGTLSDKRFSGAGAFGGISFALRDAAERYPKAFSIRESDLVFELLPKLPGKEFGSDLPHYLRFPFCEGFYRMKWGMSFTEELKIDFSGKNPPAALAAREIIPVLEEAVRKNAVICPVGVCRVEEYDKQISDAFRVLEQNTREKREYGFLSYGDTFGVRGRNWTNNEYDLAHVLFLHFYRTGNRDAFRRARLAARHTADVDTIHAYCDPAFIGTQAQHAVGHTGSSFQRKPGVWSWRFDESYLSYSGHTWLDGLLDSWVFCGDENALASARLTGDHLLNVATPLFHRLGLAERSAGWSIKALLALYRVTAEPAYLDASRRYVNVALAEQRFDLGGAWLHKLYKTHAGNDKNAWGNTPFMIGILLAGLSEHYKIEPSEALRKSIVTGAQWLQKAYSTEYSGWSYGVSVDGKSYHTPDERLVMLIAPAVAFAGKLSGNPRMAEIARTVWERALARKVRTDPKKFTFEQCFLPLYLDALQDLGKTPGK